MFSTSKSGKLHLPLDEYLQDTYRDHIDFLQKINRETGRRQFPVTPQILNRPGDGVEIWLQNDED